MKNNISELKKIIIDNKSGSTELLLRLEKYFLKHLNDIKLITTSIFQVEKHLSHFAAIENFIKKFKEVLKSGNAGEIKSFLLKSINEHNNSVISILEKHKSVLLKYKSFTTISYSKTLLNLFILLKNNIPKLKVFILESRPMLEGRIFAKELIKHGIECTIIVDAFMRYAINNSDAVIIGADQILKNGDIVNKIGSYPLALTAKEEHKKVFVVATRNKFVKSDKFIPKKENFYEVWRYSNKKLKVVNIYFEVIPKRLITKILY